MVGQSYAALVEADENLERLEALRFFDDCTHLDGIVGGELIVWVVWIVKR